MYYLYYYFQVASLYAIAFILLLLIYQHYSGKILHKIYESFRDLEDDKSKKMTELLNSIKIIKFNNWNDKFTDKINETRMEQESKLHKKFFYETSNHFVNTVLSTFLSFILFYGAYYNGIKFTVPVAFVALNLIWKLR